MDSSECDIVSLQHIAGTPRQPIIKRLKRFIRNHLNERQDQIVVGAFHATRDRFKKITRQDIPLAKKPASTIQAEPLKVGDLVRVKSMQEIEATFDNGRSTKKCGFMDKQDLYCGTVHRVLNKVERFVDERDLHVKKCNGIVLLDGVICDGTRKFGRCDRCCYIFWREEWLEKIDNP